MGVKYVFFLIVYFTSIKFHVILDIMIQNILINTEEFGSE